MALYKMQTISSRIWTQITESISNESHHYTAKISTDDNSVGIYMVRIYPRFITIWEGFFPHPWTALIFTRTSYWTYSLPLDLMDVPFLTHNTLAMFLIVIYITRIVQPFCRANSAIFAKSGKLDVTVDPAEPKPITPRPSLPPYPKPYLFLCNTPGNTTSR